MSRLISSELVTPYDAPRNAQRRAVPLKSLLRPKALPRTRESGCVAIHREGLRLLKQRDEVWKADVRDRVKQGMDLIRASRTIPAEQVQAKMTTFKKKWKKNRNLK